MVTFTALRPLQLGGAQLQPGDIVPPAVVIRRETLERLIAQGRLAASPDTPGTPGAERVAAVLATLALLPTSPAACPPDSAIGSQAARIKSLDIELAAIATQVEQMQKRIDAAEQELTAAETEIGAGSESAIERVAPAMVVVRMLPGRVQELEADRQRLSAERAALDQQIQTDWRRYETLRLHLQTQSSLLQESEIENARSEIERYVGWPTVDEEQAA